MQTLQISYPAIIVCAVLSMVLGFVWYGPLFGRAWMKIIGADSLDSAARKKMQAAATPLYLVQFLLSLFQVFVLAHYIAGWKEASGLENALWIFAAFIMPVVAAGAMWNNDPARVKWARFLIQAGYQLVLFAMFGLILGMWK